MVDYIKALEQLNSTENTYGKEINNLNDIIIELRDAENESLEIIDKLNDKLDKLKNKNFFLKDDNKKLKESIDLIKTIMKI